MLKEGAPKQHGVIKYLVSSNVGWLTPHIALKLHEQGLAALLSFCIG